ncbi:reverse transcriptase domain-containing protein [Dysgonomonas termitidis]
MLKQNIRPVPYYSQTATVWEKELAACLRREFRDKIARRLKGHHIRGFSHDYITGFIRRNKKAWPYFFRTDIAKFYPGIRHRDLIVGCQVAYRELLGLDYVPKAFKKRFVPNLNEWCGSLPVTRGIPIGSAVSAILAPVMLVPVWLEVQRRFRVPFIVFMDDVFICTESQEQAAEVYAYLQNTLSFSYDLDLNAEKTQSGRFSDKAVEFCGWRFAGGYARISDAKVSSFKERLTVEIKRCKGIAPHAFMKRVNRKIDGFANYYKHGDVGKQFESLDGFVRQEVRRWLAAEGRGRSYSNRDLHSFGLHSFELVYRRLRERSPKDRTLLKQPTPASDAQPVDSRLQRQQLELTSVIDTKLTEMLTLQRQQVSLLKKIVEVEAY